MPLFCVRIFAADCADAAAAAMNSKTPAAKVRFMLDLRKHAFAAISFVTPCAVWLDPVGPSRYSVLKGNIFVGDFRRGRLLGTPPPPRGCALRPRAPASPPT